VERAGTIPLLSTSVKEKGGVRTGVPNPWLVNPGYSGIFTTRTEQGA